MQLGQRMKMEIGSCIVAATSAPSPCLVNNPVLFCWTGFQTRSKVAKFTGKSLCPQSWSSLYPTNKPNVRGLSCYARCSDGLWHGRRSIEHIRNRSKYRFEDSIRRSNFPFISVFRHVSTETKSSDSNIAGTDSYEVAETVAKIVDSADSGIALPPGVEISLYTMFTAPSSFVMALVDGIHSASALPWWQAILVYAISTRVVMFPLLIYQRRQVTRMRAANVELEPAKSKMDAMKDRPDVTQEQRMAVMMELRDIYRKYKINPFGMLAVPLFQIPIGLASFWGIRKLCEYSALQTGGAFWFKDLTIPDPTYILAISTASGMVALLFTDRSTIPGQEQQQQLMLRVGIFMGLAIIPISMYLNSGVMVYISSTALAGISQSLFLKIPLVKSILIPEIQPVNPALRMESSSASSNSSRSARRRRRRES